MTNLSESVRARLLNIAKAAGRDLNAVLLQYFQERFLYRLFRSPHQQKFILKGALLFLIQQMPRLRPTKDIDFLGTFPVNDDRSIIRLIKDIGQIKYDDGVRFDAEALKLEKITEQNDYHGFRVKLPAYLGPIYKSLQLDIGIGDIIIPGPDLLEFPTILDFAAPRIQVYSLESVIAEKFQAMVRFNVLTSRMKDFYDILYLAQHQKFQQSVLNRAIRATFQNRHTSLDERNLIFQDVFKALPEKQEQWTAFLSRNQLQSFNKFSIVMDSLKQFIEPACLFQGVSEKDVEWDPEFGKWM